jgi:hypothetical protein
MVVNLAKVYHRGLLTQQDRNWIHTAVTTKIKKNASLITRGLSEMSERFCQGNTVVYPRRQ